MPEHARRDDSDTSFVATAKAADVGLSMGRRWVEVAIILVGLGIGVERLSGKVEAADKASTMRSEAITKSLDDFKSEVREKLKNVDAASGDVRELRSQLADAKKDLDSLKRDVAENYKIMMTYQARK